MCGVIMKDTLISDFSNTLFQDAFRQYFSELGITVKDWDGLFKEMSDEKETCAIVRTDEDRIVGFVMFAPIAFTSWFFEETCVFIREFWISEEYRNQGHGSALLKIVEDHFSGEGIYTSILTTDTAESFYLNHGYEKASGCKAKNKDTVYIKRLLPTA